MVGTYPPPELIREAGTDAQRQPCGNPFDESLQRGRTRIFQTDSAGFSSSWREEQPLTFLGRCQLTVAQPPQCPVQPDPTAPDFHLNRSIALPDVEAVFRSGRPII